MNEPKELTFRELEELMDRAENQGDVVQAQFDIGAQGKPVVTAAPVIDTPSPITQVKRLTPQQLLRLAQGHD